MKKGTRFFILVLMIATLLFAFGQAVSAAPVLVKDINIRSAGSSPQNLANISGTLFFSANTGTSGWELLKSDGTTTGTVLVKDINPGLASSSPAGFIELGVYVYFSANDGVNGRELWRTDGTESGTTLVLDINSGSASSNPGQLTVLGSVLYFTADDGVNGVELWSTDGTTTALVKDINASVATGSNIQDLKAIGTKLFFWANDGLTGQDLWTSDGSTGGTQLVVDLAIYPMSPIYDLNGKALFAANDGYTVYGVEPWTSDGTAGGTAVIRDVTPGYNQGFHGSEFGLLGGYAYFMGGTMDLGSQNLYRTDGTYANTGYFNAVRLPRSFVTVGAELYFVGNDGLYGIWKTNGLTATKVATPITDPYWNSYYPSNLVNVNGTLFFTCPDSTNPTTNYLWMIDGAGNAVKVTSKVTFPQSLTNVNGILYFTANDGINGYELWRSDGTDAGTYMLQVNTVGTASTTVSGAVQMNGVYYFIADDGVHGTELWRSDGTEGGTMMVLDIVPGVSGSSVSKLTTVGNTLFFVACDYSTTGCELWKSDGTTGGTTLAYDIWPGAGSSYPANLTNHNGVLFFTAEDGTNGFELWKSDGTTTVLVKDIFPGSPYNSSSPYSLTEVNGNLFFAASDEFNGNELWMSDGTSAGTVMVKDINPGNSSTSSDPDSFININGTLFFIAYSGVNGYELWKSDGTAAGTVMVKDINPGLYAGSSPSYLTNMNGILYFTADDGTNGVQLWKSNGTDAGTTPVTSINPGLFSPQFLTWVNGKLFFSADDGINGVELWTSDGTTGGTTLVQNINAGVAGSNPGDLINVNGMLLFTADDGVHGVELWQSDGTGAGTSLVQDINVDPFAGSYPNSLVNVQGTLFFFAADSQYGNELMTYQLTNSAPPSVVETSPIGGSTGVEPGSHLTAIFSEAMDPATINASTFTVSGVPGTVAYVGPNTATFTPTSALAYGATYTATITTGAQDLSGVPLSSGHVWSFTTADPVLTVGKQGSGAGTVTSDVGGISCGPACVAYVMPFAPGTVVTLTAAPDAGWVFMGWTGACTGTGPCMVTMDASKTVTAAFGDPNVALLETFDAGVLPAGWQDMGGNWVFNNTANNTGGSGGYAYTDGWLGNPELYTPTLDLSSMTAPMLEFKTDFIADTLPNGRARAQVDVSVNSGASWTTVWTPGATDFPGPKTVLVNLSSIAAGQPAVLIRFLFFNNDSSGYWAIDDVTVYNMTSTTNYPNESFPDSVTPSGWRVIDNTGSGGWRFDDPGLRGNLTGGTGGFAIADSGNLCTAMDTELRTTGLDFSSRSSVILQFKTDFYYFGSLGEIADVDVSADYGSTWSNVWRKTGADYRGPATENVDISAYATGRSGVMVRFHYYNANCDWWWQVDDVRFIVQGGGQQTSSLITGPAPAARWKYTGPDGGNVNSLAFSPNYANDFQVLAAVGNSLYSSGDGGSNWWEWYSAGVDVAAYSPNYAVDSTRFVAVNNQIIIYTNVPFSQNWYAVSNGAPVTAIVPSPNYASDRTLFAVTDGEGLFVSLNSGVTWTTANNGFGDIVATKPQAIAFSPNYSVDQTVFAGTSYGVYSSTNGGAIWSAVSAFVGDNDIRALAVSPNYVIDGTIFAGTRSAGVYVSIGSLSSWALASTGLTGQQVSSLAISPNFAMDGTLLVGTENGAFLSTNGGSGWTPVSAPYEPVATVAISPNYANDGTMLYGADGRGVFRSTDSGSTWSAGNGGVRENIILSIAQSPNYAYDRTVFAPVWGGGIIRSMDGGQTWSTKNNGITQPFINAVALSPSYATDHTAFAVSTGGSYKTTTGGDTWSAINTGLTATTSERGALAISPNYATDQTLFLGRGFDGAYRSTDGGASWTQVMPGWFSDAVLTLALSPGYAYGSVDQVLFAGTAGSGVFISTDSGVNWTQSTTGLVWWDIYSIAPSPQFATDMTVYVLSSDGVYKSTDGGTNWVPAGQSTLPWWVSAIALSPNYPVDQTLYAGTNDLVGVYVSTDAGATWSPMNTGFSQTAVHSLSAKVDALGSVTLFAGTDNGTYRFPGDAVVKGLTTDIAGTAVAAPGSGVQLVEVSDDNGLSWSPATDASGIGSWATWTFNWNHGGGSGVYAVLSRATDTAGTVEAPFIPTLIEIDNNPPGVNCNTTGTGVDGPVYVCFNEDMDASTINSSSIVVSGVTGSVVYDALQKRATFTPATSMPNNATYTATVLPSVTDFIGNPMAAPFNFQFNVGTPTPAVLSVSPGSGATGVPTNAAITATFSKDMDPATINDTTFLVSGVTGSVTYDGPSMTATFTPSTALASNTTYTATITTGAKDLAGNGLAADHIWSFTTEILPTKSWLGVTGNWSDGTKWSGGTVPGPTDDVSITAPGTYTVTLDTNATVNSLTLGGVSGTQTLSIAAACGDTTLTANAGMTNSGTVNITQIAGCSSTTWSALVVSGGQFLNTPSGQIKAYLGPNGGGRVLSASVNNQGSITAVDTDLTIDKADAQHVNSGTIQASGGNITITQTGTSPSFTNAAAGTINVSSGRTVSVTGGIVDSQGATLAGSGTLSLNSLGLYVSADTSVPSTMTLLAGTVTATGSGVLTNNGALYLNNANNFGNALINAGTVYERGNDTMNASFTNNGTLNVEANCGDATLTANAGMTNSGTVNITQIAGCSSTTWSTLVVSGGQFLNTPSGQIKAYLGPNGGGRVLSASVNNQGSITAVDTGLTIDKADAQHVNSGTIQASGGNITITQTGTSPSLVSSGTVAVASTRTMTITGGTFANDTAGIITGVGTINVSGTSFTNNGSVSPAGAASIGTLSIIGNYPMSAGSTLVTELSSTAAYDVLAVSGNTSLQGTLQVALNGYTPSMGDSFTILTTASRGGSFSVLNAPDLTAQFKTWDITYNGTSVVLSVVSSDLVAPVTSASPAGGVFVSGPTVTLSCTDIGSGCANIYFTADGSTPTAIPANRYTSPILMSSPTTTLQFFAVDTVGNVEAVKTEVYSIDPDAPTVTNLSPASGDYVNVTDVSYTLNKDMVSGSVVFTSTSGTVVLQATYSMTLPDLTLGMHTITGMTLNNGTVYTLLVSVLDSAGRTGSATSPSVTYDTTAAAMTINSPVAGGRVNTATISYTLSETISAGDIVIDDGVSQPFVHSLSSSELGSGSHTVNTNANLIDGTVYTFSIQNVVDLAGNPASAVSVANITFDRTAVVITSTSPATKSIITSANAGYTLSEPAASGTVIFSRTGGTPDGASPHVYTMTTPDLVFGARTVAPAFTLVDGAFYTVSFSATDLVGNPATAVSNTQVFFDSQYGKGPVGNVDNTGSSVNLVDDADVRKVQDAYGTRPGDLTWNPVCDLDHNNVIDARDLMILWSHYGQTGQ